MLAKVRKGLGSGYPRNSSLNLQLSFPAKMAYRWIHDTELRNGKRNA